MANEPTDGSTIEDEYGADSIEVLEAREAIRKRPGMYIGNTNNGDGLRHMVELLVEEAVLASRREGQRVSVVLESDMTFSVHYEGSIVVALHERGGRWTPETYATTLHAGGWAGACYDMAIVQFLSDAFSLDIREPERRYAQEFVDGRALDTRIEQGRFARGTTMRSTAAREIFGEHAHLDAERLVPYLDRLAMLNPKLRIQLLDERTSRSWEFMHPAGLEDVLRRDAPGDLGRVLTLRHEDSVGFTIDMALAMSTMRADSPICRSFAGHYETRHGGTHVDGLLLGTRRALAKILGQGRTTADAVHVLRHMHAIIHVDDRKYEWKTPYDQGLLFSSYDRSRLVNTHLVDEVADAVEHALCEWLARFPDELRRLEG